MAFCVYDQRSYYFFRAAAVRYRKRKKDELNALQKRVVELETKNLELAVRLFSCFLTEY